jgi:ribosomal protein S18 acetylase RimI-like enzyme
MNELASARQSAARVLAATLTLLVREMENLPSPLSLWNSPLTTKQIKEAALCIVNGEAVVLWVDESHPAYGVALCSSQPLESSILKKGSLRLSGPWIVEPDSAERFQRTRILAAKAKELAKNGGHSFLSIKTWHDPAIIRGLVDEGFQIASITSRFLGQIQPSQFSDYPFLRHSGVTIIKPDIPDAARWLEELGELFYDGHHQHGPFLEPDFHQKLWREVALREINKKQPTLFLLEERSQKPIGLAMAQLDGPGATLTILHIAAKRRGEGLGRLLLQELLRLLHSIEIKEISVETASFNLPALELYQSLQLKPKPPLIALHFMVR